MSLNLGWKQKYRNSNVINGIEEVSRAASSWARLYLIKFCILCARSTVGIQ